MSAAVLPFPQPGQARPGARTVTQATAKGFQRELITLLHQSSVEITPNAPGAAQSLRDKFDPGTDVFISFLPGTGFERTIGAAAALRKSGFNPVPHIAARNIAGEAMLRDCLARARDEAGVTRVLVIAGDMDAPRGDYSSALELIGTGAFEEHGVTHVGIAGYPEPHPKIATDALVRAMHDKLAAVRARGMNPFIVTQFCFSADPVVAFLQKTRADGIDAPVRIGVAGPASMATLVRFAVRCGIGNSLRALQTRTNMIGRLLSDAGPEDILRGVADALAAAPDPRVTGIHFFPFGGADKTSDWIAATLTRLYAQISQAG